MKKGVIVLLALLTLICSACAKDIGEIMQTPMPTAQMQEATPKEVMEAYFKAWSEKDFEGMQSQVCMKLDEMLLNFDIQKSVELISCEEISEYPYNISDTVNINDGRDDTKKENRDKYRPFYDASYVKCVFNIEYEGEAPKKEYDTGKVVSSYGLFAKNKEHVYYATLVKAGEDADWKIYDAPFFSNFSEPVNLDEKEEMTAVEFVEKYMELYIKQDMHKLDKMDIYPIEQFDFESSPYAQEIEGATISLTKVQTLEEFKTENPNIGGYQEEIPEYEGFYDLQKLMVTMHYENLPFKNLGEIENGENLFVCTVGKSVQDDEWKLIVPFEHF